MTHTNIRSLIRFAFPALLLAGAAAAMAAPVHLQVNARVNPLGIDTLQPVFSWQSDATARDWRQTAYEILVGSSAEALRAGHADVWDSGKRMSAKSVDVAYAGPALQSRQRCFWSVRVWDATGGRATSSEPATFEMGLLQPADWKAQWIRRDDAAEADALARMNWIWLPHADAQHVPQGTVAEFRYSLSLKEVPAEATLHVLCGDRFTATVNGVETGHKNEWTAFDWEDIREALKVGVNEIVIRVETPKSRKAGDTMTSMLAAAVLLQHDATQQTWLVTGDGWSARTGSDGTWEAAQQLGPVKALTFTRGPSAEPVTTPERIVSGSSLFRKEFASRGKLVAARLYITALGSYQAYLNGQKIGDDVLAPGFTDFRKRVQYQTYDVTKLVHAGDNTLAAMLGAGWHGSPLLWLGTRTFAGPDCLRAQLVLTYTDGTQQTVATDGTWMTSDSPVVSAEIYGGEAYDARWAQAGWNADGFHASKRWTAALLTTVTPSIAVSAQLDATVHAHEQLTPVSVSMVQNGAQKVAVFDMGQNMVGVAQLRVHGPRGTTVRLRFAERLNPDGTIYTENLRDADATDHYTLSGEGDETWMPMFTFHGFRYVEVEGYPGTPAAKDVTGIVLNSLPDAPSMKLETSSDLLNRMDQLGLWGQRGNFVSIPTDCPQRDERMGWMGDAGAFWRTGTYNFDIDSFSNKFMQDVMDAQNADGAFTNISPNILPGTEGGIGAPGWGDAGVLVPYATWLQYGNRSLLEKSWPSMERWMEFIASTNPNFLRQKSLGPDYADWLAPDPHTPKDLVATAYWALIAQEMETMAKALGRDADAQKYAALYEHIRVAYQQQYVHADGSMPGDTQTDYVVTIAMGLTPKGLEKNITDRLVANIATHNHHLTTGFLGTPYLLPALDKEGREDVVYSLLLNETYPSWGYMVEKGATTWWERWNGDTGDPSMNSYNHYAFGSVMAWVYRRVAGIDTTPDGAGFHHIVIAPQVNEKLSHVHGEYASAYGMVVTDWSKGTDGVLHLSVTVPANATATIKLPAMDTSVATMDGRRMTAAVQNGVVSMEVGSGKYVFAVRAR